MADNTQDGAQQGDTQEDELAQKIKDLKEQEEGSVHDRYQAEIEELKSKLEEESGKSLRALAELQNAKRRMEEEKNNFAAFANQGLILQILTIVENFNRSVEHLPEELKDDEWMKGILLIDQQFNDFLDKQGVEVMKIEVGDAVDPTKHEVMMRSGDGDKIVEVFEKGYEMKGRVIKTAKVKVG